jgi:hypothetical protein
MFGLTAAAAGLLGCAARMAREDRPAASGNGRRTFRWMEDAVKQPFYPPGRDGWG